MTTEQEPRNTINEAQWDALCKLRLLSSEGRQKTPSTQALREVLVDGVAVQQSAKNHGIHRQAVYITLRKSREAQATAKVLAEVEAI